MTFATKKFSIAKDLISELRILLSFSVEKYKDNLSSSLIVDYQKLKTLIQKFKYSILKNEVKKEDEDIGETFDVIDTTTNKPNKNSVNQNKIQTFVSLWIRYILTFNTQFVIDRAYQDN